jgi:ribosomal protein S18 acetylase RimI-like enzyme
VVRKIKSDQDWDEVLKLQIICAKPKFRNDYYEEFKKRQRDDYRKMSESGMGAWFGAFLGDQMVGDLGIFYEGNIGRYQNVGTHPDCRRQGICGTLVYQAGQMALQEFGINHLVMEADINYHAARIYESVGFKRTEVNYALSWWKSKEL